MSAQVAPRYAKAIFDLLSDHTQVEQALVELERFSELIENNQDLQRALCTPIFSVEQRKAVIDDITKKGSFTETTKRILSILAENRRLGHLKRIGDRLKHLLREASDIAALNVESASPLTADEKIRVEGKFKEILKVQVEAAYEINPSLIGGLRVTVGGVTYDGSLATKLSLLRDRIIQ